MKLVGGGGENGERLLRKTWTTYTASIAATHLVVTHNITYRSSHSSRELEDVLGTAHVRNGPFSEPDIYVRGSDSIRYRYKKRELECGVSH